MEEKTNESIPQEGDFKVKKKPKKFTKKTNENPKMDFSKIKENTETVETKEEKTEEVTPTEEIKVEEVASENLENKPIEGNSKEEEEDITVISEVAKHQYKCSRKLRKIN
jgi:hypothetical protein